MQLRGCGTALVTPFRQDGEIDDTALRNLVAWQVESGIDFLVPCGTTGETPTLNHDEWLQVIDTTIEVAAGRVPIVAGRYLELHARSRGKSKRSCHTPRSRRRSSPRLPTTTSRRRRANTGISRQSQKPSVTSQSFSTTCPAAPDRISNLQPWRASREIPNIIGVKEACGNMTQIAEAINSVPETFLVLSGDDAVTLPVIALGGVGVISVASNEIPHEMATMTRAALNNDWTTARTIHRKYLPLMQANFIESSPLPVKAVLAMMGKIEENYRLPLLPMRRDMRSKLQRVVMEIGLVAKPAVPGPEAAEFYIYENWVAGPHKIVLHRGSCGQCNQGKGRPAGHDANHARWHGPYPTLVQGREVAHGMTGVLDS